MKTICLYFEIHQIIHLKRYRFFEIGTDHYYYDDYANEQGINEVVERSYVPALNTLIEMAGPEPPAPGRRRGRRDRRSTLWQRTSRPRRRHCCEG